MFSNSGNGVIDDINNRVNKCNIIGGNIVFMVIVVMKVVIGVLVVLILESSEFV